MQIRTSEVFDYVKKLEKAITNLTTELMEVKSLVVSQGLEVGGEGISVTAGSLGVSVGDIDITQGDLNVDAGSIDVVTGGLTVAGTTTLSGSTSVDGGPLSYGANDSGGTGFRYVLVPNAV